MDNKCKCCNKIIDTNILCNLCYKYCKSIKKLKELDEVRRVTNLKQSFGDTFLTKCLECYLTSVSPCHQCLDRLDGNSAENLVYTTMSYDQLKNFSEEFYSGNLELPDKFGDFIAINNI
jgi:hypothetical protein